jgi:hypothetical protein
VEIGSEDVERYGWMTVHQYVLLRRIREIMRSEDKGWQVPELLARLTEHDATPQYYITVKRIVEAMVKAGEAEERHVKPRRILYRLKSPAG